MAGVKGQRSGGHNAKSVDELQVQGTYDPSRHAGIDNPLPVPGIPKVPAKLGKVGRREWHRTIEFLEANRTLSRELAAGLFAYCRLFEEQEAVVAGRRERKARIEMIEESLKELKGDQLVEAISCLTKMEILNSRDSTQIRQYASAIRPYLVEFGLTPASRSRVRLVPIKQRSKGKEPSEQSPLEKLQAAQRKLRAV